MKQGCPVDLNPGQGSVLGHVTRGCSGDTAADAVEFTRLTSPPVLQPPRLKEDDKIAAEDKHGPLAVNRRQAPLDPLAHGVPVNTKEAGNLLHCVVAVNLDEPMI